MKIFKCTLILALILLSITNVALCQKEEERASLFPGRSVAVLGVTVTWNVTPKDVGIKEELEEEQYRGYGTVDIAGPKNSMKNLKLRDFNISKPGINLYIDEVYIKITGHFQGDKLQTLSIYALKQSQKRNVTAAPQKLSFYVSHLCPVFLNEWKFSMSGEKETFPDGSEYYILTVENPETKERETIPLSMGANRKVGRYDIYIDGVYELTKTALLEINAGIDESIRGRDAYVENFTYRKDYPRYSTHEEFFNILGERYGFTVEWVEYLAHPESIDDIKNKEFGGISFSKRSVKDLVDYFPRNQGFGAEWKTPTHLKLWYKDYDQYLADERKRKESEEEKKKVEEEFKKDYATETRAYYFKTITSKTAKELIDPELDTYLLVNSGTSYWPRYWITKGEVPERNKLVAKSMEQCAADERTNALILTAIPKTHERFEKILEKIDAVLEKTEKPEALKPFMLSVTLLQGVRSASKSITRSLRMGGQLTFRDLRLRVVRVNENNVNDELDDSVELEVNTSTSGMAVTIEESHLEFIDDYVVSVPEIKPSDKPEEALAVITIRYPPSPGAVEPRPGATLIPTPEKLEPQEDITDLAKQFGLSKEDMEFLGVQGLEKVGQGIVHLVPERGEAGTAMVSLSANYSCILEFQDVREPYLIVRGSLRIRDQETVLLENTIYLESGKPTLLGITNLREALILLVQLRD